MASVSTPDVGDQVVHELPPAVEPPVAKPKEMMTGNDDATTGSPLQQLHRIVADTGWCLLAIADFFIDRERDKQGIYVGRQWELVLIRAGRLRGLSVKPPLPRQSD